MWIENQKAVTVGVLEKGALRVDKVIFAVKILEKNISRSSFLVKLQAELYYE